MKFALECIGAVLAATGCWFFIVFGALVAFEPQGLFPGLFLMFAGVGGLLNGVSTWRQLNEERRSRRIWPGVDAFFGSRSQDGEA